MLFRSAIVGLSNTAVGFAATLNIRRSNMRRRFDDPRLMPPEMIAWNARAPSPLEEQYVRPEQRLYKGGRDERKIWSICRKAEGDMAQVTTGLRAILSSPAIYELVQDVMGAKRGREKIATVDIRPFPGMRILDLGCGTAEILSFLPNDVDYVGYDISSEYIDRARTKFYGRGEFHCGLLAMDEAKMLQPFDLVMAIGVLHHLDDGEARGFVRIAKAVLKPGGRLLTQDPCYAPGQNPIARFLISKDRGRNVRDPAGYAQLAASEFPGVKGVVAHQAWIPYTRWVMEAQVPAAERRL